jgi:hypothetical protein
MYLTLRDDPPADNSAPSDPIPADPRPPVVPTPRGFPDAREFSELLADDADGENGGDE